MPVSADYLDQAAQADLLYEHGGAAYVCGATVDPLTGERILFAEYVAAPLLCPPGWPSLREELRRRAAASRADQILVRKPADAPYPEATLHRTHFLALRGAPGRTAPHPPGIRVHEATTGADRAQVLAWLATAHLRGYGDRGHHLDEGDVRRALAERYGDAVMLVAAAPDGAPVGHVTLDPDAVDDITGAGYVELVDVLVAPGHPTRGVQEELVAAAFELAARRGRHLVGNIACTAAATEPEPRCARIAAYLCGTGWRPDHDILQVP
jgi:GNAT superfamily N-acetyltransferase